MKGRATLLSVIASRLDPRLTKVMSLDVFDTLLLRGHREPTDVFVDIGRRAREAALIADWCSPSAFRDLRHAAEARLRQKTYESHGLTEVSLPAIYGAMPATLFPRGIEPVMAQEIEAEAATITPDGEIVELAKAAAAKGIRIIAVSNTYFTPEQLERLLSISGLRFDKVYNSNVAGLAKEQGLFRVVLDQENVRPAEILHVGDSAEADLHAPARLGMQTLHLPRFGDVFHQTRTRETAIATMFGKSSYHDVAGMIDGLRVRAWRRLQFLEAPRPHDADGLGLQLGVTWFGPVIAGFCEELVQRYPASTPLLFITREGFKLQSWFRKACEAMRESRKTTELSVSRATLFPGALRKIDLESLTDFINSRRTKLTGRDFYKRFGFARPPAARARVDLSQPLVAPDGIERFLQGVLSSADEVGQIRRHCEERRKAVQGHTQLRLRQIGIDTRNTREMVVCDLGWSGQTFELLSRNIAPDMYSGRMHAHYLAIDERVLPRRLKNFDIRGWLFEGLVGDRLAAAGMRFKEIVEQICMPDVGSVTGYAASGEPDREEPIKRDPFEASFFAAIDRGVDAFIEEYFHQRAAGTTAFRLSDLSEALQVVYASPFILPSASELQTFRKISHDENNFSDNVETLQLDPGKSAVAYANHEQIEFGQSYWPMGEVAVHRAQSLTAMLLDSVAQHPGNPRISHMIYYGQGMVCAHVTALSGQTWSTVDLAVTHSPDRRAAMAVRHACGEPSFVHFAFDRPVSVASIVAAGTGDWPVRSEDAVQMQPALGATGELKTQGRKTEIEVTGIDAQNLHLKVSGTGTIDLNVCLLAS